MMSNQKNRHNLSQLVIDLAKIWKGSVFARLTQISIVSGITFWGVFPWWNEWLIFIVEKMIGKRIDMHNNIWLGIFLILLGIFFAVLEYKRISQVTISDNLEKNTEENAQLSNRNLKLSNQNLAQSQFNDFKKTKEKDCYSNLRNLVNKFTDMQDEILSVRAKEVIDEVNAGNAEKLIEYIEYILFDQKVTEQYRVWFFNYLGDATGKPILYQFVQNYEEIMKKAKELQIDDFNNSTPLGRAYKNVTDNHWKELRRKACWEAHVS